MTEPAVVSSGPHAPPPREDSTWIDRHIRPLRKSLRWLGLALLAAMIALPALQVMLREFTRLSFIGAGELTRFMLICVVFVTLPYVVCSGANIRMEEILSSLPHRLQRGLRLLITATGMVVFAFAAYSVYVATMRNLNNATPTLGIPYWIFFSAAFIGLTIAAAESAIQFVKALRGRDIYVTFTAEQAPDDDPRL